MFEFLKYCKLKNIKRFYLDQTLTEEDSEADEVDEEDKLISLTDIFKCLHISTLTNDMVQFKEQFTNDRHDQLKVRKY